MVINFFRANVSLSRCGEMRKQVLIFGFIIAFVGLFGNQSWAVDSSAKNTTEQKKVDGKQITMTALDAVKLAGRLVDTGDYEHATQI